MAALKWEAVEALPMLKRSEITETSYDEFVHRAITMNTEYRLTPEDICSEQYHPKGLTEPKDAFAHLEQLIPRRENAFVFSKRNHM